MNTRQKNKRMKEVSRRCNFINKHVIWSGRMNGKTRFERIIWKAVMSKKYRPFKLLEKGYREIYVGVDLSTGKDYTALCHYRTKNGIRQILKIEYE